MSTDLLGDVVAFQDPLEAVTLTDVRTALTRANLPPDAAPELTARAAFSRACKDLKEQRQIDKVSVDKGTRETKFQLTHKEQDGSQIDFRLECFVYLNLDTGVIRCDDTAIETQAQALFATAMQARTATDITRLVQGMFKAQADLFALVPNKGVAYFVPEVHRAFTEKIEAFYTALGGRLCRFPVPKGTEVGNQSVKNAVDDGLASMADELKAAVESWDETTRTGTMEKAVERWQAIAYKIDAYGEYLGAAQSKLKDDLEAYKSKLADKIVAVGELKDKAAEERKQEKERAKLDATNPIPQPATEAPATPEAPAETTPATAPEDDCPI